jgi:hypothetical protein
LKGWVVTVNPVADEVAEDSGRTIRHDPEVQQARAIAEAARCELVTCVSASTGQVDLAEATRMLTALRAATALAEDAEDRVLVHNALLTTAEANRRTQERHASPNRRDSGSSPSFQLPSRAVVTGLAAALTAAGLTAAVIIARSRAANAALPRPADGERRAGHPVARSEQAAWPAATRRLGDGR